MRATATITPRNRSAYTVELADDPFALVNGDEVGWLSGTVNLAAPLSAARSRWIRDAPIVVHGPFGDVFFGTVTTADARVLTCLGWFAGILDGAPRGGVYSASDASAWTARTAQGVCRAISPTIGGALLALNYSKGAQWNANAYHGFIFDLGQVVTAATFKGTIAVLSDQYPITIHTGNSAALGTGEDITWAAAAATWTTDGLKTQALTGSFRFILLQGKALGSNSGTAGDGLWGSISHPVVFAEGITTINPYTIINDCLDSLPAGSLGGRDIANVTTSIESFVQPGTNREIIAAVRQLVGGAFRGEARSGVALPFAVYRTYPTEARYQFTEGPTCDCSALKLGTDTDNLYSAVRFDYTDAAGRTQSVFGYDSDPSHYLVITGRTGANAKWADTQTVATTDATIAQAAANLWIWLAGADMVNGTVTVLDDHAAYIQPGELIGLTTRRHGTVTAYIAQTAPSGYARTVLTLGNTSTSSDIVGRAITRWSKIPRNKRTLKYLLTR